MPISSQIRCDAKVLNSVTHLSKYLFLSYVILFLIREFDILLALWTSDYFYT